MTSRLRWLLLGPLLALGLVVLALPWLAAPLAEAMLVDAPRPEFAPLPLPAGVQRIEVSRPGHVRIVAWWLPVDAARGSVAILHGIRDSKDEELGRARHFNQLGLSVLLVDSRGHGASSGRYLTYGVQEARDLVAVLDAVEARGELQPPLMVVGTSYGAATALQHGAIDPRVRRVVAAAPFASLREVVPPYLRWMIGPAAGLVPQAWIDARVQAASARAGFDPDAACPRCAAPHIGAPVLLIHSRSDERIPFAHSERIAAVLPPGSRFLAVDDARHVAINDAPRVSDAIDAWLLAGAVASLENLRGPASPAVAPPRR